MKHVTIEELKVGDVLCTNIYFPDGRVMLKEGSVLSDTYIKHINKLELPGLYIEDPHLKGVRIDDGLGFDLRSEAVMALKGAFTEIEKKGTFNVKKVLDVANSIVDQMMLKPDFLLQLKETRSKDSYIIDHSVSVCQLSILCARGLEYNMLQIKQVAVGALLHDIGYAIPGLPNPYLEHPRRGFDLLRKHHEVSLLSAHMALQHHETLNGLGFPLGVQGAEFRDFSQICGLANEFDHFINALDSNRLPHEGIEFAMSKAENTYNLDVVKAFVKNVAPYPIGTRVKLNNGTRGIVSEVHKANPSRPTVRLLDDGKEVTLLNHSTLFVQGIIA